MKGSRPSREPRNEAPRVARELPLSAEDVPPDPPLPRRLRRILMTDQAGISPSPDEHPRSWWGEFGVFAGGFAVAASLYAGHPHLGGGAFGQWRIAGIALGLLGVAAGQMAVLWHSAWRNAIKAAVVVVTITAAGGFAFFGVEQVPTGTLPACSMVANNPTLENGETVYCREGNGLLSRISIEVVDGCITSRTYLTRQENGEWSWTGSALGCQL